MNLKQNQALLTRMLGAWALLRPSKPFGGLTLSQFNEAIQPSLDSRTVIARLEAQLAEEKRKCEMADQISLGLMAHVIASIEADPCEGKNGELIDTMGFGSSEVSSPFGTSARSLHFAELASLS